MKQDQGFCGWCYETMKCSVINFSISKEWKYVGLQWVQQENIGSCFLKMGQKNLRFWKLSSSNTISSVELLSRVWLIATPWTTARQASLSFTNSRSLPKPMSMESVMPSNHLILCHPFFLLPSIFPSITVFSNESALCNRWPSIGVSASTSVLPMNTQDWSPLRWTRWISVQSKGLSRVFSNTTVQTHQFFGAQPSSQSNSHIHTWLLEKT